MSCWDIQTNKWTTFYENKQEQAHVFLTLCEDDQGRIWAGTYSSGIYVIDGITNKELAHYSTHEENSPIKSDFVFDIFKDSSGDIWIGGMNTEVICYRTKEHVFQRYNVQPLTVFAELSPIITLLLPDVKFCPDEYPLTTLPTPVTNFCSA